MKCHNKAFCLQSGKSNEVKVSGGTEECNCSLYLALVYCMLCDSYFKLLQTEKKADMLGISLNF